ncbi:hypothetical protein RND71_035254 [Anisodus tanguticus]|uniref:Uncharacterized protein n=1 Tax=Anisodus tanguticus TaxID=243964 RepID=A0AAE1R589_9SOLA|nr:hypothetical protein RND71_035254 [Anisodus tanguticus]
MEGNSGYKDYVAGLMVGIAMVITGHPTVKVKLQKHNTEARGIKYKNGLHCAARILKTEGVKGLYRGATSSFIGMAFESSLVFGIYSQTKLLLQCRMQVQGADSVVPSSSRYGGPLECAFKTGASSESSQLIDIGVGIMSGGLGGIAIYGRSGLRGCYMGLGPTIVRVFPANAAAIVTWELSAKLFGNQA